MTTADPVKLIEPPPSEAGGPFWEASRRQELVLPWCAACRRPFWFPREVCPRCLDDAVEWHPASGDGVVHAVSVHHRPGPGRDPEQGPYAVALVELPEGVRMMTNVVGCPPGDVAVGDAVRVVWHPLSDGRHLPWFTPA